MLLESSVKFLQSVMIWGAVTSAGVGALCFLKSKVNAAIYQDILEHFMLPSADKLYGEANFLFPGPDITVLDWSTNMPD